jgi:hypothetical protein
VTWEEILRGDVTAERDLTAAAFSLLAQARATWPAVAMGERVRHEAPRKTLASRDAQVVVQLSPGRRRSVHARVDEAAIAARPCFLCPPQMPPEECGLAWEDLALIPNPFPAAPGHLTLPSREHRPQRIAGRTLQFCRLAARFGGRFAALYNGPRCGASAPDHFHFQACEPGALPLLQVSRPAGAHEAFGRSFLVIRGASVEDAAQELDTWWSRLAAASPGEEPMVNLVALGRAGALEILAFPRRRHRPTCYDAPGESCIRVSPAALEMAGLLVVTEREHFERLDAAATERIYREVSVPLQDLREMP